MMRKFAATLTVLCLLAGGLIWAGGNELRLEARIEADTSAGDISGKVKFRQRFDQGSRRQFSAQIEGFEPGSMYDVMIAGSVVGKIVVDDTGVGDLNYDDNFEPGLDDPASQFPSNFPGLDGGESVEIGPLSGTLQFD